MALNNTYWDGVLQPPGYTDAEAVAAADASDKFVERNVVNDVTALTTLRTTANISHMKYRMERASWLLWMVTMYMDAISTNTSKLGTYVNATYPQVVAGGTDGEYCIGLTRYYKGNGTLSSALQISTSNAAGGCAQVLSIDTAKMDVKNLPIKDPKNHVASALSGTKRVIEILIGTNPYYFEVYPTKA